MRQKRGNGREKIIGNVEYSILHDVKRMVLVAVASNQQAINGVMIYDFFRRLVKTIW